MAWAFDNSLELNSESGSGSGSNNDNFTTSGSDRLLIVTITLSTSSDNISGVTYNGVSMTELYNTTAGANRSYVFYLLNPASGTNTLSVTRTGSISSYVTHVVSYTGVTGFDTSVLGSQVSTGDVSPGELEEVSITPSGADNLIAFGTFTDYRFINDVTAEVGTMRTEQLATPEGIANADVNSSAGSNDVGFRYIAATAGRDDDVRIWAISFDAGPPSAEAERDAEIHGVDTANAERDAEIDGGLFSADERDAEIDGIDTANAERDATVHGSETANAERDAEVSGGIISTGERDSEIHGIDTDQAERDAEVTGSIDVNDERDAEVHGVDTANAERDSEVSGVDTASAERNAEIEGVNAPVLTAVQNVDEIDLTWTF